jgi:16S rRNA (cytidine1402-2'-O)-methyltransferase
VAGTLYVVATPLGNLEDVAPRTLRTLRTVSRVACEDTRRTRRLLHRFGVDTPTLSCHEFNERERLEPVLAILRGGGEVALVSDGGTPCISDPGALLVRAVLAEGIRVSPLPGPCAVTTLLSASGIPGDRFLFDGFLPHRAGERRRRLRELRDLPHAVVVFESPRRLRGTLEDIAEILGDRTIVLGRELTKIHETVARGTAREIAAALPSGEVRGEVTLVIAGIDREREEPLPEPGSGRVLEAWRAALETAGGDRREALRRCSRALGMRRAELYRLLAELGAENGR